MNNCPVIPTVVPIIALVFGKVFDILVCAPITLVLVIIGIVISLSSYPLSTSFTFICSLCLATSLTG